jgi:hypothetical protein
MLQLLCVCYCSTGGFKGDGPHFMSYDVLDDEHKELFNLAFKVCHEFFFGGLYKMKSIMTIHDLSIRKFASE